MKEQNKTEEKVFSYLEKYNMVRPGDKIVLGVSGGADSVCLFFLLLKYREKIAFDISVVHVNHGIREDASEDVAYVESLCKQNTIPFHLVEEDVRKLALEERCSEEDAGRRLRYRSFREVAQHVGGAKIAVAHNANDRAETMLMHLFRGSGLRGICGIEPVRDDIIRPILCLEREEIEDYLCSRGIAWQTDSTNAEDAYTRNRIRHNILPYAEREISEGIVRHMCHTADLLSETEQYLTQQTLLAREKCVRQSEIDVEEFILLPIVIRKRLLLNLTESLSPTGKDISAVHIEDLLSLFEKTGNRTIHLPFGIRFWRSYSKVCWEIQSDEKKKNIGISFQKPDVENEQQKIFEELEFLDFSYQQGMEIPENQYTKWFDYDKIALFADENELIVRYRKSGDYLTIADGKDQLIHKSLKDYMITNKIPKEQRGVIPVLAQGSHILWIIGYRISEYYKIDENTRHVLQVTRKNDCSDNGTEEKDGRAY